MGQAVKVTQVAIGDINPAKYNPRKINPEQLAHLEASIKEFGFVDPLIVNADGTLIGGHQRLKAAKRIGLKKVPAIYVDLDKTREKALNIALNKISGEWDEPQLAKILEQLDSDGYDVRLTGFDPAEMDKLFKKLAEDEPEKDEAIEPPKNPITKFGDLYTIGEHRLLCGDATNPEHVDRLMNGRAAHTVFTDPPYGVAYRGTADFGLIKGDKPTSDEGFVEFLAAAFRNMVEVADDEAAFYIWHDPTTRRKFEDAMAVAGIEERQYIIWVKEQFSGLGMDDYRTDFEPCFYAQKIGHQPKWAAGRAEASVWRISRQEEDGVAVNLANGLQIVAPDEEIYVGPDKPKRKNVRRMRLEDGDTILIAGNRGDGTVWVAHRGNRSAYTHPTQKPTSLGVRAIRNSTARGQVVLDPFAGSGSTLEAAHDTGRTSYLMEIDPGYCDVITARAEKLGLDVHLEEPVG